MNAFHFTDAMRALCEDIVRRSPQLTHVNMAQVLVSFSQARGREPHGVLAAVTPLRFENGALIGVRGNRICMGQRFMHHGVEQLYVLSFYLPRFQNLDFREKLITVFHELWHISPKFDGSARRMPGPCHVHGRRASDFDDIAEELLDDWLRRWPPESLHAWLRSDFRQLVAEHGAVVGQRASLPKLLPLRLAGRNR